jgi:hypothetical protein
MKKMDEGKGARHGEDRELGGRRDGEGEVGGGRVLVC